LFQRITDERGRITFAKDKDVNLSEGTVNYLEIF
jgi:hypothetical protein